ncbi:hypothetical protein FNH22_06700 [Fulvivirga sp. M361]|uniref:hypothetical protein n=1 Tax=Fulvivirga sp. M361 TaxID=2594266 RepID=UPI00117BC010|nr:hypothetical protein [Fulvivirga sp. M361]TRX60728.1 hypothetical protein FNH22_06700 [Fulvivirga sp. M361]
MKKNVSFDVIIKEKVTHLEESSKGEEMEETELWEMVRSKRKPAWRVSGRTAFWIGGVAASLTLLLIIHFASDTDHERVTFSRNMRAVVPSDIHKEDDPHRVDDLILSRCAEINEICQTPEFKELRKEFDLIEDELKDLQLMISHYGADEFIIQSKIKIENHRSEIAFRMMQMLMS